MAQADHYIGQGNQLPPLDFVMTNPDGSPADITSPGVTVTFRMKPDGGCCGKLITGPIEIIDGAGAAIRYNFAAGDTDDWGFYRAVFVRTDGAGKTEDFPNNGYLVIRVRPKI